MQASSYSGTDCRSLLPGLHLVVRSCRFSGPLQIASVKCAPAGATRNTVFSSARHPRPARSLEEVLGHGQGSDGRPHIAAVMIPCMSDDGRAFDCTWDSPARYAPFCGSTQRSIASRSIVPSRSCPPHTLAVDRSDPYLALALLKGPVCVNGVLLTALLADRTRGYASLREIWPPPLGRERLPRDLQTGSRTGHWEGGSAGAAAVARPAATFMTPRPVGVGTAAAIVSGSVILSRLLGLGRETLLAALLGVTAEGDVYRYAFLLPDLLNYLLAGGFLSITLIPLLSRRIEEGNSEQAQFDFTAVFRWVSVAIAALTAGLFIFAEPVARIAFASIPETDLPRWFVSPGSCSRLKSVSSWVRSSWPINTFTGDS